MTGTDREPVFHLVPGEVHALLFDLEACAGSLRDWRGFLSAEERKRAKSYRFNRDRSLFIVRRGLLRQLVEKYSGQAAAEIFFAVNPCGKLFLPGSRLKFNLSCSQAMAVYAFTLEQEIGADIEVIRPLPELDRMAERWFSPGEQAALKALRNDRRLEAFFHVWTQKEAFLKAGGEGLSRPLQDFTVSADPDFPGGLMTVAADVGAVSGWKMHVFQPAVGYRAAVCVQAAPGQRIRWYRLEVTGLMPSVTMGKLPMPV